METLDTKALKDMVTIAESIIPRKPTMPILTCIALTIYPDNQGARVESTDFNSWFTGYTFKNQAGPGRVHILPGKELLQALKAHKAQSIEVEALDDFRVRVGQTTLCGQDPAEYPAPWAIVEPAAVTMIGNRPELIAEKLEYVARAASVDSTRYNMNSVFFEATAGGCVSFTATDGHRLHKSTYQPQSTQVRPEAKFKGLIISEETTRAAIKAIRTLKPERADLIARHDQSRFTFYLGDDAGPRAMIVFRPIDADFPDYRQVLPKEHQTTIENVPGAVLLAAAADALTLCGNAGRTCTQRAAKLKVTITADRVGINCNPAGRPEVKRDITGHKVIGADITLGINSFYLKEALRGLDKGYVNIYTTGPLGPFEIQGADRPDDIALVMPVRLEA